MQFTTNDFDYFLPQEQIAQTPLSQRDACRLLHFDRRTKSITHDNFSDLRSYLKPGDRLVFNNTRVIPARLYCTKKTGGNVELFFIRCLSDSTWVAMVKPARGLNIGAHISVKSNSDILLVVTDIFENGHRVISLCPNETFASIKSLLDAHGQIPLPHYINRDPELFDSEQYQTVFAHVPGAVAAPTAGLHFTEEFLFNLAKQGIDKSEVTLHVGPGTFSPVKEEDPHKHSMHEEWYALSAQTAHEIEKTKKNGGRIIAIGTTVVRVLEHCSGENGQLISGAGSTRMLILPGYQFKTIDALVTNFHLPKSTLIMLVCAFGGMTEVLAAYKEAVSKGYRFYSYGDAMFLS
jgi:S-adenosylmethionine:tRNA ribosyltransferase-isomerase